MPGTRSRGQKTSEKTDIYQEVTDRVIAALESGTVPWQKPWKASTGRPVSMSTRKPYRGVNVLLLGLTTLDAGYSSPWWGTYKQISELGGQVRKGEKSTQVVFFKHLEVADRDAQARGEDKTRTVPLLRGFRVFNAQQADNLPERFYPSAEKSAEPEQFAQPEEVLGAYLGDGGPSLRYVAGDRAYYQSGPDRITLPERCQFSSPEKFYATALHEAAHSSGHPSRLNRPGIAEFDHFGSERYAKEELAAELTAAMLCAETGVDTDGTFEASAAYIQDWLTVLKDDRKLVVSAAAHAERAAERVLEPSRELQRKIEAAALDVPAQRQAEAETGDFEAA